MLRRILFVFYFWLSPVMWMRNDGLVSIKDLYPLMSPKRFPDIPKSYQTPSLCFRKFFPPPPRFTRPPKTKSCRRKPYHHSHMERYIIIAQAMATTSKTISALPLRPNVSTAPLVLLLLLLPLAVRPVAVMPLMSSAVSTAGPSV